MDNKEQMKEVLRRQLDQQLPLASPGDKLNLTLLDNRSVSGTLLQQATRQFKIESSFGAEWIPYNRLTLESRLQVDASERDTWLEERALEQILNQL